MKTAIRLIFVLTLIMSIILTFLLAIQNLNFIDVEYRAAVRYIMLSFSSIWLLGSIIVLLLLREDKN